MITATIERLRWLAVPVALLLLAGGLAQHRTDCSGRSCVLGIWSPAYAGLLAVFALGAVVVATQAFRAAPRSRTSRPLWALPSSWIQLAALLMASAYLWDALLDRRAATRILDGNLAGSIAAGPITLEWFALGCLILSLSASLPDRGPTVRNLGVVLAALGTAGWLVEGTARAAAIVAPETQGFPTNRTRIWGRRYIHLNTMGFRDGEHPIEAAPGVRRVAVIGDSYAAGVGIEDPAQGFGPRLAARLARETGSPWEVIVAARGNTHTLDHLKFLQQVLPMRPELVILVYYFNDLDYLVEVTPRSVLTMYPDTWSARLHLGRLAFVNSFAVQEVVARLRQVGPAAGERQSRSDPYADSALIARHLEDLKRFALLARGGGAEVRIVPFDIAVVTGPEMRNRHDRFVAQLDTAGIPVWDAGRAFDGHSHASLRVNDLDGHPNAAADSLLVDDLAGRAGALVAPRALQ